MLGTGYHLINPQNVSIDPELKEFKRPLIKKITPTPDEYRVTGLRVADSDQVPIYLKQTQSIKQKAHNNRQQSVIINTNSNLVPPVHVFNHTLNLDQCPLTTMPYNENLRQTQAKSQL